MTPTPTLKLKAGPSDGLRKSRRHDSKPNTKEYEVTNEATTEKSAALYRLVAFAYAISPPIMTALTGSERGANFSFH
jgi:hypothetical protein